MAYRELQAAMDPAIKAAMIAAIALTVTCDDRFIELALLGSATV
jgi:hypothetical protein